MEPGGCPERRDSRYRNACRSAIRHGEIRVLRKNNASGTAKVLVRIGGCVPVGLQARGQPQPAPPRTDARSRSRIAYLPALAPCLDALSPALECRVAVSACVEFLVSVQPDVDEVRSGADAFALRRRRMCEGQNSPCGRAGIACREAPCSTRLQRTAPGFAALRSIAWAEPAMATRRAMQAACMAAVFILINGTSRRSRRRREGPFRPP